MFNPSSFSLYSSVNTLPANPANTKSQYIDFTPIHNPSSLKIKSIGSVSLVAK